VLHFECLIPNSMLANFIAISFANRPRRKLEIN
jgi:hypothetical protein